MKFTLIFVHTCTVHSVNITVFLLLVIVYIYWRFFITAALCNRGAIIFLPCDFYLSFFFSSPNLRGRRLDVYHTLAHGANLECRSEMRCTRLAANTGRKKVAKNRHLGTIAQLCRAISSQLRHVSTIGKKLVKQQYLLYMSL